MRGPNTENSTWVGHNRCVFFAYFDGDAHDKDLEVETHNNDRNLR